MRPGPDSIIDSFRQWLDAATTVRGDPGARTAGQLLHLREHRAAVDEFISELEEQRIRDFARDGR
jgi:hypothetical protein